MDCCAALRPSIWPVAGCIDLCSDHGAHVKGQDTRNAVQQPAVAVPITVDVFVELQALDWFEHRHIFCWQIISCYGVAGTDIALKLLAKHEKGESLIIRVVLPPEIGDLLIDNKPKTLTMPQFAAYLIELGTQQGVDNGSQPLIMGEPAARQGSIKSNTNKTNTNKTNKNNYINDELQQHEALIQEFWRIKKGSRGQTAWNLLMTELMKLLKGHGHAVVAEQLTAAINGKWQGVSCSRYEQFKPAAKADAPPEPSRHPAGRVFTAKSGFSDEPSNPALRGLV